jgi:hypothetical protein
MKKNRGDEQIRVIIHIYMNISQGNSLVATFISNKQKVIFFLFFLLSSSTKSREKENRMVFPGRVGRIGNNTRRKVAGKGGRRENTVQKMCTHVYKCKNDTC